MTDKEVKELLWEQTVTKVITAIENIDKELIGSKDQEVMLFAIEYAIFKICETEENFNDCLDVLNKYMRKEDGTCKRRTLK